MTWDRLSLTPALLRAVPSSGRERRPSPAERGELPRGLFSRRNRRSSVLLLLTIIARHKRSSRLTKLSRYIGRNGVEVESGGGRARALV